MEVNFNIAANVIVLEPKTSFDATCYNHKQNLHNTHKRRAHGRHTHARHPTFTFANA